QDGNGHGTHVAGTVAGGAYGVAKKAKVVAVRGWTPPGRQFFDQVTEMCAGDAGQGRWTCSRWPNRAVLAITSAINASKVGELSACVPGRCEVMRAPPGRCAGRG
ncbi:S8 family serine peptidase, partial [Streptomyces sp. NPDC001215]